MKIHDTVSSQVIRVRLAGRATARSGRVEILYNGRWGTVCDDSWDTGDAQYVKQKDRWVRLATHSLPPYLHTTTKFAMLFTYRNFDFQYLNFQH